MAAVLFCLGARLRQRRRAVLGLVLIVGLAGGLAIGALGVARRTERRVRSHGRSDERGRSHDQPERRAVLGGALPAAEGASRGRPDGGRGQRRGDGGGGVVVRGAGRLDRSDGDARRHGLRPCPPRGPGRPDARSRPTPTRSTSSAASPTSGGSTSVTSCRCGSPTVGCTGDRSRWPPSVRSPTSNAWPSWARVSRAAPSPSRSSVSVPGPTPSSSTRASRLRGSS